MKKPLWNKNFILLLQGQMVSSFGDSVYLIALSFFVLQMTKSTAFVGMIMGLTAIPKIFVSPIAGVVIDNYDKKKIIIIADFVRGVNILLIALLVTKEYLPIWALAVVAVIDGICASFFNPSVESIMPELVDKDQLIRANAVYSGVVSGASILGQSVGGILYRILGAPLLFVINGVSFVFSAFTEGFIQHEGRHTERKKLRFWEDVNIGVSYIAEEKGLRLMIATGFFINFLFGMIRVLLVSWFTYTPVLGVEKYGILNMSCSMGVFTGISLLTGVKIKAELKYLVSMVSMILFAAFIGFAAYINTFSVIVVCFFAAFIFQVVFNTIIQSTIMIKTPENIRGKVAATKMMLGMIAVPLGNFGGGWLGELISPRPLIMLNSVCAICLILIFFKNNRVREYF